MSTPSTADLVFLHPSDEIYGADRMLLEMLAAVPEYIDVEVWLPIDLDHPEHPLCELLAERGIRVEHVDIPVMRRDYLSLRGGIGLLGRCVTLFRLLRRRRPPAIYCTTSAGFLGAPVARLARIPRIIGHVQEIWTDGDRRILGLISHACHELLAISTPVRSMLPHRLQVRTAVVVNGTPDPARSIRTRARTGPLMYVVASRWNRWKGHGTLLQGWDRAGCPGTLVVLGGPPPSGDQVDVSALAAAVSDPASVEVVGEVPDLGPYLDEADVIVMPSDEPEPFGLVAIEAFARERPVIASDAGGLAEIVTDDVSGWLFPPKDAEALAQILRRLDHHTVEVAGRAARKVYEERYTSEQFARRWRKQVFGDA